MKTVLHYVHFDVSEPGRRANRFFRSVLVGGVRSVDVNENDIAQKFYEVGNSYFKNDIREYRILAGFNGKMCLRLCPEAQGYFRINPPCGDNDPAFHFFGCPVYSTNLFEDLALLPQDIPNDRFWKMLKGGLYDKCEPVECHGLVPRHFDTYRVVCTHTIDAQMLTVSYFPEIVELDQPLLDENGHRVGLQQVCPHGHKHYVLFEEWNDDV